MRIANEAGTAQLGIVGGSQTPEVDEAAMAEGRKMVRKRKPIVSMANGLNGFVAFFILCGFY